MQKVLRIESLSENNLKSKACPEQCRRIQNLKWLGLSVIAFVLVVCGAVVQAQQPKNVPRIGFMSAASPSANKARLEAFREALRELGYVEAKNLLIEYRFADGRLDRLDEFATEFVRLKLDVIVTAAPSPTRAAKKATSTIPIVMAFDSDPVGNGFVASLARPGGNVTGLSTLTPEISGKQLELLKEMLPRLVNVTVLTAAPNAPGSGIIKKEMEVAAGALRVQLQQFSVQGPKDMEAAFGEARRGRADALVVLPNPVLESARKEVAALAAKNRLPAIYSVPEYVEAGGLLSYGVSFVDLYRRAATYVDKILKGAKPAELPVEQPTKFEFVINLNAAKQIGLTIPPNVLARADRVIK